jgi:hypothetical protein
MKKQVLAFVVGLLTITMFGFGVSSVKLAPPPQNNQYMSWLISSSTYKEALHQSLLENTKTIINNFQNNTSTEAVYKLKFCKEILNKGAALNYVISWTTNVTNHTDIGDPLTGLGNAAAQFNTDIDVIVKGYYSISW